MTVLACERSTVYNEQDHEKGAAMRTLTRSTFANLDTGAIACERHLPDEARANLHEWPDLPAYHADDQTWQRFDFPLPCDECR